MNILEKIRTYLGSAQIEFKEIHHEITRTSEESALARGEDISIGGKALVLKLDSSSLKKLRFANKEELMELTGLVPGFFSFNQSPFSFGT